MIPVLYTEINIICIIFLITIFITSKGSTYSIRFFKLDILSCCFFFLTDTLWVIISLDSSTVHITANWIINALYFIFSGVIGFFWFLHSESVQNSILVKNKRNIFICSIPIIVLAILSITSIKTHLLFFIDENNEYNRGPLYFLQLTFSYCYILFTGIKAFIRSIKTQNFSDKRKYLTLAMFIIPTFIAGFLQTIFPGCAIINLGVTFSLFFVFITNQEQSISIDSLSGLNNRNKFMQTLSEMISHYDNKKDIFLLMMDLDYFKSINDSFGHIEGDKAICKVATALKSCCKDKEHFIARYGGDEFAAICEIELNTNIQDFITTIKNSIKQQSEKCPYKLSISIGYAKFNSNIANAQDFIKLADSDLYNTKKERIRE